MATEDTATSAARDTLQEGYEAAAQYVHDSELGSQLREFVEREPWIAIAAAFAIGYVAAQIVKRIS